MGREWEEVTLDTVYEFRSGLSKPRTEFGFGYSFLSFKDVFYNYFVPQELVELVNSTERERELCSIKRGDIFLTRTSETMEDLGVSCVALRDYVNATFNGFTKRLRPKVPSRIVPEYAAYYFRSPKFRRDVTAMSSLSTRASLNNDMLSRLKIVLPSIKEQAAIGNVLKSLDNKIELNRRMNQTLEAIAQAIFKSWFVDFDPVRAKMEGREPYGMDAETAALFPEGFEESELGPVPRGWRVGKMGEEFRITMGQSPPGSTYNEIGDGLPFYQGRRDFGFRYPTVRVYCDAPTRIADKGDTLVSVRAPVGDLNMADEKCCIGRGVAAVRHKSESRSFTYAVMQSLTSLLDRFEAEGTVFGSINKKDFNDLPTFVPPRDLVTMFEALVYPLDQRIEQNTEETQTLAALRDALLPKLLSGEVRVPRQR